tara:strand:+ start:224 stop:1042 length:819 start_codon:yes stop_codon:yes gene_type:complete
MKIFKHKLALNREISCQKNLSFVPTMGGLHNGHKYLIKKAKGKKGKVIVSIYVNPKQFNSKKDFKSYPRNLSFDLNFLRKLKVDYVYIPNFKDIYSFKTKNKIFLDKKSKILCGKFRKSHFYGVVSIVNRLLEIINPKYIFFGKKDYQQLYLIKKHIKKRKISTTLVSCKTIRTKNGVAHSSRNKSLNNESIKLASKVYNLLRNEKKNLKNKHRVKFDKKTIYKKIKLLGIKKIDYIECLNLSNFKKALNGNSKFNIFIAYYLNRTRLIDNI